MANLSAHAKELLNLPVLLANQLIKHAGDVILIMEAGPYQWPDLPIIFANDALFDQMGYSLEEVIGQTPRIFHRTNTDPETQNRIHLAISKWQVFREDVLNYKKDGSDIWQDIYIFPIASQEESFTHWVMIQHDITQRKLYEKNALDVQASLVESQQRLKLATTAGGVGIWEYDVVNDSLVWDDYMYVLYGIDQNQFTSEYNAWQSSLHPDDRVAASEEFRAAFKTGEYKAEFRIVWPDTTVRHIRGLAHSIKDSNGAVIRWIGTNWDISEQKVAGKKIEELAFFDHLTSLPNRRLFADRLQRSLKLSLRSKQYCALLSLDLDHFKKINDLYGHDAGDLVLQAAAQCLLNGVRAGDSVARMGGDEFMILLEGLGSTNVAASAAAEAVAEKILTSFNSHEKLTSQISMGSITIGITLFMGGQRNNIDELMKQCDLALYQAKEAGRNCIKFYDKDMQAIINARASLESILRQAIQNEWFVIYFQPQMDEKRQIVSAEVLLRLNRPQYGLMHPVEFIELAESTELILPIGWWVVNAACLQLASWSVQANMAHLHLSVNISIKQFKQEDFVSKLIDTVVRTGANPRLLTLELTETIFLTVTENIILKMQTLRDYGFNFSLDDFGTGYSSLSYLKNLPFNELKIDKTFVSDLSGSGASCDIVYIIILMGKMLGMKVVAEGVETKEQLQKLQDMGCQYYQGYLFSRPIPVDQLVTTIMG